MLVAQSCPTLCDPMDCSLLPVHDILLVRTVEWVAHALFQGIFLAQELKLGLQHCRQTLYHLSHRECRRCRRPRFSPWVENIPWRRKWQPTPVFLPGESHGQRSLVGYRPRGHKELDTTEHTLNFRVCLHLISTPLISATFKAYITLTL